jgi:hypothetical protein
MHASIDGKIESKIVEVESEAHRKIWEEENPGWVDHKMKLKKPSVSESVPLVKKEESVVVKSKETKVEEDFDVIKDPEKDELDLAPDILDGVIKLLKGKVVGMRRGLSLTSFANLYGYSYHDVEAKKALKPDYEKLLEKLDGEIEQKNKTWVYKGVSFKKRITKKNRPKR